MFTSLEKLSKFNPVFENEFEEYQNISKNNKNYSDYENQTEYLDSLKKKCDDKSLEALKSMTPFDAFDNISIPFILNDEKILILQ
jgi:hypothetical protein